MEFIVLLGTPLLGAVTLGIFGGRRWAPEANVGFSLVTFLAACALTSRIVAHGNLLVAREQFFIDAFNVFLVTLTAFVGLTTSLFSRPYMRIEADHGRVSAATTTLVSQHVPAVHRDDADCPHDQQHGAHVGGDGSRHLVHRVAGDALSNPRESRGRLEVFHSLRRGHLPSPVRHHSPVFCGREGPRLRGRQRAAYGPT